MWKTRFNYNYNYVIGPSSGLNTQEKVATDAINQADELLNDATQKLHVAINEPSMNQQSVKVAATKLDVAKTKRVEAMQHLQKIILTIVQLTSAPQLLMVFTCVYTICALPK